MALIKGALGGPEWVLSVLNGSSIFVTILTRKNDLLWKLWGGCFKKSNKSF